MNPAPLKMNEMKGCRRVQGIPDRVYEDICRFAVQHRIEKVVLFGSRARGDACERSDIDLACTGGDFTRFALDVPEFAWTLLGFDIVSLDACRSERLLQDIREQGILLYKRNGILVDT